MKPGGILHNNLFGKVASCVVPMAVSIDVLARTMVDLVVHGGEQGLILNQAIIDRGKTSRCR